MLSLKDACAQTWKNDITKGTASDTNIELLSISDSELQFRVNRDASVVSGTVNMIKFDALKNGNTAIKVKMTE